MKCLTDTKANGNFIGTCTYLVPENQSSFCSGVYNVDQFYNVDTNTQVPTGPCAGSIAVVDASTGLVVDQPVTGGTGAYKGASGNAIITAITDSTKCPLAATLCYKLDFNLD